VNGVLKGISCLPQMPVIVRRNQVNAAYTLSFVLEESICISIGHAVARFDECNVYSVAVVVNAKFSRVFCSSSCALADPVAGLALADRFTARTLRPLS
jgi:hypothetical protein